MLKKEIMKTQSKDLEKASEYRQALVQAIHSCAVKFPDVAGADWAQTSCVSMFSAVGGMRLSCCWSADQLRTCHHHQQSTSRSKQAAHDSVHCSLQHTEKSEPEQYR